MVYTASYGALPKTQTLSLSNTRNQLSNPFSYCG